MGFSNRRHDPNKEVFQQRHFEHMARVMFDMKTNPEISKKAREKFIDVLCNVFRSNNHKFKEELFRRKCEEQ